jgi:hypothetical protein
MAATEWNTKAERPALRTWSGEQRRASNAHYDEGLAIGPDSVDCSDTTALLTRPESQANKDARFGKLPTELGEEIVTHLAACDPTQESLRAFALTSKSCESITRRERFSAAYIRVTDDELPLKRDVSRLQEHLKGREEHVRILELKGSRVQTSLAQATFCREDTGDATIVYEHLDDDVPLARAAGHERTTDDLAEECTAPEANDRIQCEEDWRPVVSFLEEASLNLKDFVWACPHPMPMCVLQALHRSQSKCRLHVHTLSLPGLYQRIGYRLLGQEPLTLRTEMDNLLAASKCLHSLIGPTSFKQGRNGGILSEVALSDLLSKHNSSVRHVHLYETGRNLLSPHGRPWLKFRTPKVTDHETGPDIPTTARLATLHTPYPLNISTSLDARTLVSLTFNDEKERNWSSYYYPYYRIVTKWAETGALSALQELVIQHHEEKRQLPYDNDIANVLRALQQPLKKLRLVGVGSATFAAILEHHGARLCVLHLQHQCLSISDVESLVRICRQVHDLHLGIQRTLGDEAEINYYTRLGEIPALEKLRLELHPVKDFRCSKPGSIRWAFLSVTLDEPFALSVFNTIRTDPAQPVLAELVIQLASTVETLVSVEKDQPFGEFIEGDFRKALENLAPTLKVERTPQGTRVTRQERRLCSDQAWDGHPRRAWPASRWESIQQKIWPTPDENQRRICYSLPLANGGHEKQRQTMLRELTSMMNHKQPTS